MAAEIPTIVLVALATMAWVISMLDVATTRRLLVRNLPKEAWFFYVMLFPVLGGLVWMLLGRPAMVERKLARQIDEIVVPTGQFVGPEDTPEWATYARSLDLPRS